jgi:hypothetical protein
MKAKQLVYFSFIFSLFISCQTENQQEREEENQDVKVITLKPIRTVESIGDSIFFKRVDMSVKGNDIAIADNEKSRVIVVDSTFRLKYITGSFGQGPGDFNYATSPYILDSTLYVVDEGNVRINAYRLSTGKFIDSFRLPLPARSFPFGMDSEGNFYIASTPSMEEDRKENMIVKLNAKGEILKTFGSFYPFEGEKLINRNYRHVQINEKDQIISVAKSLGFIEIHDKQGKLIKKHDISQYEPIKRALDSMVVDIKSHPERKEMVNSLITRAIYRNNRLYVTFTDRIGVGKIRMTDTRHILVFEVTESKCNLEKILRLETDSDDQTVHYLSLQIDEEGKYLYVQGITSYYIYVFKLP